MKKIKDLFLKIKHIINSLYYFNSTQDATVILFTIMGKKEGYERTLRELISNKKLIEKFHPTEAIKLGFIFLGETVFLS